MASLLVGVEAGGWEEAGRGVFRHSYARIGETWLIDTQSERRIKQDLRLAILLV
jgi:hypothetical protein